MIVYGFQYAVSHASQGDACNLPTDIGKFSVIHGANLLCRLPEPRDLLNRLPDLLVPGGVVVSSLMYTRCELRLTPLVLVGPFICRCLYHHTLGCHSTPKKAAGWAVTPKTATTSFQKMASLKP